MKKLYILGGCNGAGKTTLAYDILPEILQCKEFVNADEIARGLSPFQPEAVAFTAGKLMSNRVNSLLQSGVDFAVETTLSAVSYRLIVDRAHEKGYTVILIYFWLNSPELAKKRVKLRVREGGHNVPEKIIERRYHRSVVNFFHFFIDKCDTVMIFDNSDKAPKLIMERNAEQVEKIYNPPVYDQLTAVWKMNSEKKK